MNVNVFLLIFLAAVNCSKLGSKLPLAVVASAEPCLWLRKVTVAFVIEMMPTFQTHGCESRKKCVMSSQLYYCCLKKANQSLQHCIIYVLRGHSHSQGSLGRAFSHRERKRAVWRWPCREEGEKRVVWPSREAGAHILSHFPVTVFLFILQTSRSKIQTADSSPELHYHFLD